MRSNFVKHLYVEYRAKIFLISKTYKKVKKSKTFCHTNAIIKSKNKCLLQNINAKQTMLYNKNQNSNSK